MTRHLSESHVPGAGQSRMHMSTSPHITPAEWRWLTIVASLLVLTAFAPLFWFAIEGTGDYQFMGALHNYIDGGTYLSKMEIGYQGNWLVTFLHTPDLHNGALIQVIYPLMGHFSRLTGISILVMFHVARLIVTLFMYVAIYQLGAVIWTRVRARRMFFTIATIGSGFGWLLAMLTGETGFPDLTLPEAFPFFSSLMNVHFPLTFALMAMLVSILIRTLRPGGEDDIDTSRALPLAGLLSLGLAFLYPQSLVPLGAALFVYTLIVLVQTRRIPQRLVKWLLAIGIPALPLFIYYALIVNYNPVMAAWNAQNVTLAPPLFIFLAGFGLPLLIAIPGIYRAMRRFELDGDRLILLWLIAILFAVFFPTNIQRRFAIGMMLPVAYFATRAIEDVWLRYISRRQRAVVFTLVLSLIPISQVFVLAAPILLFMNDPSVSGAMIRQDYVAAFAWLRPRVDSEDVILASPNTSVWIPGYTGGRVVYAHPYETIRAQERQKAVEDWYSSQDPATCERILDDYAVRFVVVGPNEREYGQVACADALTPVVQIGDVTLYAP